VPVPASAACVHAAALRIDASKLDAEGRVIRARAALDAANAECPSERAASAELELRVLVSLGLCGDARALAPSGAAALDACTTIEAAPRGDARSRRLALHEAQGAERAGDFAKAKALYLVAWSELHPDPRALESAARMTAAAGDAVAARRLRDCALVEAEATEHAHARLTLRAHLTYPRLALSGRTALLSDQRGVGALDLATGEYRSLFALDEASPNGQFTVEPTAMLALLAEGQNQAQDVVDLTTGERLAHLEKTIGGVIAPDGATLAAIAPIDDTPTGLVRLFDPATGAVKASAIGLKDVTLNGFVMGSSILAYYETGSTNGVREGTYLFDVVKRTGVPFAGKPDAARWAYSPNGAYFVALDLAADHLRVRDVAAKKELVDLTGRFYTVDALTISNDGKTVVSASSAGQKSSVRIYDVGAKKWTFTRSPGTDQVQLAPDGKTVVLESRGVVEWDVATGVERRRSVAADPLHVTRMVKGPDGALAVLSREAVTIVTKSGELRTLCAAQTPASQPWTQPTNFGLSPSGRSLVCSMSDGSLHVFETTGWTERAVVKKGAPTPTLDGDLGFSADDATLLVTSGDALVEIDVATQKERKRTALRHPKMVPLAQRHARFSDGTILVQKWAGGGARFDANGAWIADVPLVAGVQYGTTPQAFSPNGATYAAALDKAVHLVDLRSGTESVVVVAAPVKALALSADGATALVATSDGTVVAIAGGKSSVVREHVLPRVAFLGNTPVVWTTEETLVVSGAKPIELTMLEGGFIAQDDTGFEARGASDAVCAVGRVFVTRETCSDRSNGGRIEAIVSAP
jgi:WD40 repeat protein